MSIMQVRLWTVHYATCHLMSFTCTSLALIYMRHLQGNIQRSSIRFVMSCILACTSISSFAGGIFQLALLFHYHPLLEIQMRGRGNSASYMSCYIHHGVRTLPLPLLLLYVVECLCIILLAYWILLTVREILVLILTGMDRGPQSERAMIRKYVIGALILITSGVVASTVMIMSKNRVAIRHRLLVIPGLMGIPLCLVIVVFSLFTLNLKGRSHEHVYGGTLLSPLYQRLRLILTVYAVSYLPYCIIQILSIIREGEPVNHIPEVVVGLVYCLKDLFGSIVAIVMTVSQSCCLIILDPIIPSNVKDAPEFQEMLQATISSSCDRVAKFVPEQIPHEPPSIPIFVYTDIESSSALWARSQLITEQAIQVHDTILRSLLLTYRGYEVTTAGDAFQLAFHTVAEAVNYCFHVQAALLSARWPNKLESLSPSTRTVHSRNWKRTLLFRGLRVRMGIHDAHEQSEGKLITHLHPVTGKLIYIGVSEMIAQEIGGIGLGGQVLVSARVAEFLSMQPEMINCSFRVAFHSAHEVVTLGMTVKLYQIISKGLKNRRKVFERGVLTNEVARLSEGEIISGTMESPRGSFA